MRHCPKKYPVHEAQGQSIKTSGNKVKQNYINVRLNHVDLSTICEAQIVVFGLILVNLTPATVLFDSSSSHFFISSKHVADHKILMVAMRKPMLVKSPRGKIRASCICLKVSIDIKGVNFLANLVVLDSLEIDIVLGRGWFSTYQGEAKWDQCSVLLTRLCMKALSRTPRNRRYNGMIKQMVMQLERMRTLYVLVDFSQHWMCTRIRMETKMDLG
jgi:hypothetical protein